MKSEVQIDVGEQKTVVGRHSQVQTKRQARASGHESAADSEQLAAQEVVSLLLKYCKCKKKSSKIAFSYYFI